MSEIDHISPAVEARTLLAQCASGALATRGERMHNSLVLYDGDLHPCFLLSDLAQHTRNLGRFTEASLLIQGPDYAGLPMQSARLT